MAFNTSDVVDFILYLQKLHSMQFSEVDNPDFKELTECLGTILNRGFTTQGIDVPVGILSQPDIEISTNTAISNDNISTYANRTVISRATSAINVSFGAINTFQGEFFITFINESSSDMNIVVDSTNLLSGGTSITLTQGNSITVKNPGTGTVWGVITNSQTSSQRELQNSPILAVRRSGIRNILNEISVGAGALFNSADTRFEVDPTSTGLSMNIVGIITNNSGRDLTLMVSYMVNWDTNNVGVRTAYLEINGDNTQRLAQSTVQAVSVGTVQTGSAIFVLPNTQTFELKVWQNSGGTRTIGVEQGAGLTSGFGTILQVAVIK